ncbi:MAG: hypothetical protein HKO65_08555 [Gemmatimonadetes bacterium]|nr:hypothetical protein [Gemmatimonadota bacterium]
MAPDTPSPPPPPRMALKPTRVRALLGIWELDGEMIRFLEDPVTGELVALTCGGGRVNPMRVISHGTRMIESEIEQELKPKPEDSSPKPH